MDLMESFGQVEVEEDGRRAAPSNLEDLGRDVKNGQGLHLISDAFHLSG
jgi:hypothetical protein